MVIKIGDLDIGQELANSIINIDTILTILAQKGLITQEEFNSVKKEIVEKFKKEHPDLFK